MDIIRDNETGKEYPIEDWAPPFTNVDDVFMWVIPSFLLSFLLIIFVSNWFGGLLAIVFLGVTFQLGLDNVKIERYRNDYRMRVLDPIPLNLLEEYVLGLSETNHPKFKSFGPYLRRRRKIAKTNSRNS